MRSGDSAQGTSTECGENGRIEHGTQKNSNRHDHSRSCRRDVNVETIEGESGCTASFGPTPWWSPWEDALRSHIGDEIVSWVELMSDEEE